MNILWRNPADGAFTLAGLTSEPTGLRRRVEERRLKASVNVEDGRRAHRREGEKSVATTRITVRSLARALMLLGLAAIILPVPQASAQNGFFDMLFGRRVPAGASAYADPSSQWTPFGWRQQEV